MRHVLGFGSQSLEIPNRIDISQLSLVRGGDQFDLAKLETASTMFAGQAFQLFKKPISEKITGHPAESSG